MKYLIISLTFIVALWSVQLPATLYKVNSSPYAANIAQDIGDTLTILVSELTETVDDGTANEQKRYDNFEFILEKFFFPKFGITDGFSQIAGDGTPPGFKGAIEKKYTANAQRGSKQEVTTEVQARVIETINENQFIIRGHRNLNINGKYTKIFISGIVRKKDINANNTILSTKIADAILEVNGEVVSEDLAPGMIEKLLGWLI